MTGGTIAAGTVETKSAHIEAVVGVIALVIAALVAVSIIMIEINAGSMIRAVGPWTAVAYWLIAAGLVALVAFLCFLGWVFCTD